jgi:prepilin-type N-terminal cleavage/methylation domain-containing protein
MKKKAFTLAEVLITLGIIGVVATLTMPSLIAKYREKETVVKLKKFYSAISQAYMYAVNEHGTPENWGLGSKVDDPVGRDEMINILAPHLNITKNCGPNPGCLPDVTYKFITGTNYINFNTYNTLAKAMLADGSVITSRIHTGQCNQNNGDWPTLQSICGSYCIDVNCFKPPNTTGKDFFCFWLTKNGIVPFGLPEDTERVKQCRVAGANGEGCTAWVIYNENMDYLHCKDLSWSGKTKCK